MPIFNLTEAEEKELRRIERKLKYQLMNLRTKIKFLIPGADYELDIPKKRLTVKSKVTPLQEALVKRNIKFFNIIFMGGKSV